MTRRKKKITVFIIYHNSDFIFRKGKDNPSLLKDIVNFLSMPCAVITITAQTLFTYKHC